MSGCGKYLPALVLVLCASGELPAGEDMVGQPAPQFRLPDQNGGMRQLSDYKGQWVVLYFYPRDDTPGCTEEACRFRDDLLQIKALGAQVLGVSLDSAKKHAKFADKYSLQFPLLADVDGTTAAAYGSLRHWGFIKIAHRHTFIIDPAGRIAKIYRKVAPSTHSTQVIEDLRELVRGHAAAAS